MIEINGLLTVKPQSVSSKEENVKIVDIKYDHPAFMVNVLFSNNNMVSLPYIGNYFKEAIVNFLDETVEIGSTVNFIPKQIDDLKLGGWTQNKKGYWVKTTEKYFIGNRKSKYLGSLLNGTLHLDKKGVPIILYDKYVFTEGMVQYIFQDDNVESTIRVANMAWTRKNNQIYVNGAAISHTDFMNLTKWLLE